MLLLGLEELPAQWSETMVTEFTWMVPTFEAVPEPLELPVDALAVALSVELLAEADGCEPAVCPELAEFPVLALAAGVSEPEICTSCPTWLLSWSLPPVRAYELPFGCVSV